MGGPTNSADGGRCRPGALRGVEWVSVPPWWWPWRRDRAFRVRAFRVPTSSRATGSFENLPSVTSVFHAVDPTGESVRSTGFATRDDAAPSAVEPELLRDTAYV